MRTDLIALCVITLFLTSGCHKAPKGGPRMETALLSGRVRVDGAPAKGVLVECHPQGTGTHGRVLSGHTDVTGSVVFSTYVSGDGVPPGDYALTFQLVQSDKEFGPGKDVFKGKYAHPEKSEVHVSAKTGEPNDFGVIDLTTKGGK